MNRPVLLTFAVLSYFLAVFTSSFAVYLYRGDIPRVWEEAKATVSGYGERVVDIADTGIESTTGMIRTNRDKLVSGTAALYDGAVSSVSDRMSAMRESAERTVNNAAGWVLAMFDTALSVKPEETVRVSEPSRRPGFINASYDGAMPSPRTLSDIKRRDEARQYAEYSASIEPAAGVSPAWAPEEPSVTAEAVLVPRRVTVISSSQDGRIADIPVNHGDRFKEGDLLVAYDCTDVEAEAEIALAQKDLTKKKAEGTNKLFKLDIISDLDRLGAEVEDKQAQAKARAYGARMEDCRIRARFDGRVTNRLANPGEYTRTDRVLLEVASDEPLQAEFLVPSKWLRWVNIGAPVTIKINETDKAYSGTIQTIHGEVDPVSQSIQMVAILDTYQDPLLPGMSGQLTIEIEEVRKAGVRGYLEAGYAPKR